VTIDGRRFEGRVVELLPGRHAVNYSAGAVYLLCNDIFANVELLPGRLYRLKRERFATGYRDEHVFWIEDVEGGETL
jgi:hypothetical protein